jgi:diacylglycerol kinase (ATP)
LKRLYLATINSWNGLVAAARSEQAIREELVILLSLSAPPPLAPLS